MNRIDEIITFRSLDKQNFVSIAALMLSECAVALSEKGIRLTWTDEAVQYIAENSYSVKYGARNMRRYIQTEVEDRIASAIIAAYGKITAVDVDVCDGMLTVRGI